MKNTVKARDLTRTFLKLSASCLDEGVERVQELRNEGMRVDAEEKRVIEELNKIETRVEGVRGRRLLQQVNREALSFM